MALKKKITKEAFDKLADVLKSEYKASGDDYVLDVDGDEDTGALKRAKDREKQRADEAETLAKELQKKLDEGSDVDARKKGDIEALEKSWAKKHSDLEADYKGKLSKSESKIKELLVDSTATAIAGKISTVPTLMAKAIKERLAVDFSAESPTLRVLGADGKVSALTTEELTNEFLTNKDYANIIIASKASGGRTPVTKPVGSADEKPVLLSQLKPKDLVAQIQARKEQQTE